MKNKKLLLAVLSFVLLVGIISGVALSASAASGVTESNWLASPEKSLVKCEGEGCDHKSCDYVYSFAVVGDTQNLNIYDVTHNTSHMNGLYNWILNNKDEKNIQYVMGLGDITQAYYSNYATGGEYVIGPEWDNAAEAIGLLDGKIGYSLVRGNHDVSKYYNGKFGTGTNYYTALSALAEVTDESGKPMAGFLDPQKVEDTYRKIVIGEHKYIIFTLDWHPTEACLDWVDTVLGENPDYRAIVTLHSFIYRDGTITDDYEDTFPYENLTGTRPNWEEVSSTGGNVFPKVLWQDVLSKHANVEMILCGHVDEDNIITTQLEGENGNTVTAMLIDGQSIDSTVEPVGLVAMFYVSADGKVINVEYISTVREAAEKNAYLGANNQFEICLDYTVSDTDNGWTETAHGSIRTDIYNAYPFHVLMDDDSDESTDAFLFGSYSDWEQTLKAIHDFCGNTRPSAHKKMKTYYVVMSKDYTDTHSGLHDNRAAYNFGKTVLDLNGKTLTLASADGVFVPFYVTSAGKYPDFAITNGNISITGKSTLAAFQSGSAAEGENCTFELSDLNITYSSTATPKPLITTYNGSGTGSYVDFTVSNCNIDSSALSGALTVFGLKDTKNNNHVSLNIIGGSIKGSTAANTVIFTLNQLSDKVTFSKGTDGNYMSVTLADNAKIDGVFYSDEKDTFLEFGEGVVSGDSYVYSLKESGAVATDYGIIPESHADASKYPFVLFKNGEMIHTSSDWKTLIDTDFKGTANYQSGCTLLLRADYNTSSSTESPSWFARINDLTIDLGGNTFTRSTYHMFQLFGTEDTAHSTSLRVINGTIASASNTAPIAFNNADTNTAADTYDVIFDGVRFDLSATVTGSQGILVSFGDGIKEGINADVTLNNCTIYRGSSTRTMTLFGLIDEKDGKVNNKIDVNVVINGGELISDTMAGITLASYSPAREGMSASADSLALGKGSDGKFLTAKLPASYTLPTTKYALSDGNYALGKDSDDGEVAYCGFNKITTPYGDISTAYASIANYPIAVFYNGAFKNAYSSYNKAIGAAVAYIDTSAEVAVCDTAYVVLRSNFVATDNGFFSGAIGNLIVDLQGYTLSSSTSAIASINMNYNTITDEAAVEKYLIHTSNITFKNGTIKNDRSSLPIIAIDQTNGGTTTVPGAIAKKIYYGFDNVTFKTGSQPVLHNYDKTSSHGLEITVFANNCTFDFTGATEGVAMISLFNKLVKADIELVGCNVIASKLDSYNVYKIGSDDTAKVTLGENGVYMTVTQTAEGTPANSFVTSDGGNAEFKLVSSENGKYVYNLFAINEDVKYDVIPEENKDDAVVLFVKDATSSTGYKFVAGFATFNEAAAAAGLIGESGSMVDGADCVILFTKDYTVTENTNNVSDYYNNVIIDLDGHKVTITNPCFITLANTAIKDSSRGSVFGRITMKNGTFSFTGGGTATSIIRMNGKVGTYPIDFEGITISSTVVPYLISTSGTSGAEQTLNSVFTDCVFDYTSTTNAKCYMLASGGGASINATVVGCKMIAKNSTFTLIDTANNKHALAYYGGKTTNDTLKCGAGNTLCLVSGTAAPTSVSGGLSFVYLKTEGGYDVYEIAEKHTYGNIPAEYTDGSEYPILLFSADKTFVGAYTSYKAAVAAAGLIGGTDSMVGGTDCVMLFRDDFTLATEGSGSITDYYHNVTIDLGGNTVTLNAQHFLSLYSGATLKNSANGEVFGKICIKNGSFILAGTNTNVSTVRLDGNKNPTVSVTYPVSFEGVRFVKASDSKVKFAVASTASITTGTSKLKLDLTDCVFDFTGATTETYMFASGNARVIEASVFGGSIIAGANNAFKMTYYIKPYDDTLVYKQNADGEYITLSLNEGLSAPAESYPTDKGNYSFVKIGEENGKVEYTLSALPVNTYTPKMSLTLDSNLIANIYIPADGTKEFILDGVSYSDLSALEECKVEIDGAWYYLITVELPSAKAARNIVLAATVSFGEDMVSGTFTFSLVKYAEKLLGDDKTTETEKTLILDVLQYIKAAYAYFGTADADKIAKIDSILGDYSAKPTVEGSASAEADGIKSATLVLDGTPSIRFYLSDGADASKYVFYIDGKTVATEISADGTYVDIDAYAYALCETVTYTIDGIDAGSYHINSYYSFVSGEGDDSYTGDDKAALIALTECFWKYLQSARAYRNSVVNN